MKKTDKLPCDYCGVCFTNRYLKIHVERKICQRPVKPVLPFLERNKMAVHKYRAKKKAERSAISNARSELRRNDILMKQQATEERIRATKERIRIRNKELSKILIKPMINTVKKTYEEADNAVESNGEEENEFMND